MTTGTKTFRKRQEQEPLDLRVPGNGPGPRDAAIKIYGRGGVLAPAIRQEKEMKAIRIGKK